MFWHGLFLVSSSRVQRESMVVQRERSIGQLDLSLVFLGDDRHQSSMDCSFHWKPNLWSGCGFKVGFFCCFSFFAMCNLRCETWFVWRFVDFRSHRLHNPLLERFSILRFLLRRCRVVLVSGQMPPAAAAVSPLYPPSILASPCPSIHLSIYPSFLENGSSLTLGKWVQSSSKKRHAAKKFPALLGYILY